MVADIAAWLGFAGPVNPNIPDTPLPDFASAIWLGLRQFQYALNNQRPTLGPVLTGPPTNGVSSGTLAPSDFEGDPMTISVTRAPSRGTVILRSDGTFTYSRAAGQTAADEFVVTVDDGDGHIHGLLGLLGLTSPNTYRVVIPESTAIPNRAPTFGDPGYSYTVNPATGRVTGRVLAHDLDRDTLTIATITVPSADQGTLEFGADGSFIFTPTEPARQAAAETPSADTITFRVSVSDGQLASETTVELPVLPAYLDGDGALSLRELDQLIGAGVADVIEREDGTVATIQGAFTSTPVRNAADAAAVINQIAFVLGGPSNLASPGDIEVSSIAASEDGSEPATYFFRLRPRVGGVPVAGGEVVLATLSDGTVTGVVSGLTTDLFASNVAPLPGFTEADAVAVVRNHLAATLSAAGEPTEALDRLRFNASLLLRPGSDNEPALLVWRVVTSPSDDPELPLVLYDVAANGPMASTIVDSDSPLAGAWIQTTDMGLDLNFALRFFAIEKDDRTGAKRLRDWGRGIEYRDSYGGTIPVRVDGYDVTLEYPAAGYLSPELLGWSRNSVSLIANFTQVYDFYAATLGFYGGRFASLRIIQVPEDYAYSASFFPNGSIRVADGNSDAVDVLAHEYAHALMYDRVGIGTAYKFKAVNEAYADILGMLTEKSLFPSQSDEDRWSFAEDSNNGILRSLKDPSRKYNDFVGLTHVRDIKADTSFYAVSTILSHSAYVMMTDQRTSNISVKRWARLFSRSMHTLNSNATLIDARRGILSAASAMRFSRTEIDAMRQAFEAAGIADAQTVKFELTWGARPGDLDSHLTGPSAQSGERFHVFYANRTLSANGKKIADLDYDDTNGYGPERTTIRDLKPGVYEFYVHDFSNGSSAASRELAYSSATVRVTTGDRSFDQTFTVDPRSSGTYWQVCKVVVADNGSITITPVGTYSASPNVNL